MSCWSWGIHSTAPPFAFRLPTSVTLSPTTTAPPVSSVSPAVDEGGEHYVPRRRSNDKQQQPRCMQIPLQMDTRLPLPLPRQIRRVPQCGFVDLLRLQRGGRDEQQLPLCNSAPALAVVPKCTAHERCARARRSPRGLARPPLVRQVLKCGAVSLRRRLRRGDEAAGSPGPRSGESAACGRSVARPLYIWMRRGAVSSALESYVSIFYTDASYVLRPAFSSLPPPSSPLASPSAESPSCSSANTRLNILFVRLKFDQLDLIVSPASPFLAFFPAIYLFSLRRSCGFAPKLSASGSNIRKCTSSLLYFSLAVTRVFATDGVAASSSTFMLNSAPTT
ncbi:hypothetical protein C8R46DRAFT_1149520 [Mycena filopes]|nr:hypothetical protein C8R46DRAFT_1149520 [Mycena filopes]